MELVQLACCECDYGVDLLLGTQEADQTFSDLNEDFAYYRLFQCPADMTVHSINVHDREFDGACPEHKVKLQSLADLPRACPKCGGPVQLTRKDILKPQRGE